MLWLAAGCGAGSSADTPDPTTTAATTDAPMQIGPSSDGDPGVLGTVDQTGDVDPSSEEPLDSSDICAMYHCDEEIRDGYEAEPDGPDYDSPMSPYG